jgi:hypothetical protein
MRVLLLYLGLLCAAHSASAAETAPSWPATVKASYSLRFNGIEVGKLDFKSDTSGQSYSLSSKAKVSVFFGAFKWSGTSKVVGAIESGAPTPGAFSFDWKQNKKGGKVQVGFKDNVASDIAIQPTPKIKSDTVPLTPAHRTNALDPMSAILMLTKADGRAPCDRRVGIFDGKQRYDIVLSPKRVERIAATTSGGRPETGHVCRVTYEPIAGHRDNEDTRNMVANRDAEIVMRRIPGSQMLVPHSVSIPTSWGTGYMVAEKIEVIFPGSTKSALIN